MTRAPRTSEPGRIALEEGPRRCRLDPRTPVLIGYGQVNQHDDDPAVEPVDLMVAAARAAADPRVLEAVDSVRIVNLLSWRYRDPGLLLAQRIGAADAATPYTGIGGNVPQSLVNQACLDIQRGPRRRRVDRGRRDLAHPDAGAGRGRQAGLDRAGRLGTGAARRRRRRPDGRAGRDPDPAGSAGVRLSDVRAGLADRGGESPTSTGAASASCGHGSAPSRGTIRTPGAASRLTAEQIWQPGRDNRMISWPYTKLMNSNNMVDQGAALILTSVGEGHPAPDPHGALGFPVRRHRRPRHLLDRRAGRVHRSPAIRIAGARALELAGNGVDDIDWSTCTRAFPSAVQVAARELGPAARRSRAAADRDRRPDVRRRTVEQLRHALDRHHGRAAGRQRRARVGLITANGGYLTKHSFGVYGTEPPTDEFRWEDVQSAVDAEPTEVAEGRLGGCRDGRAWTTPFSRDGAAGEGLPRGAHTR